MASVRALFLFGLTVVALAAVIEARPRSKVSGLLKNQAGENLNNGGASSSSSSSSSSSEEIGQWQKQQKKKQQGGLQQEWRNGQWQDQQWSNNKPSPMQKSSAEESIPLLRERQSVRGNPFQQDKTRFSGDSGAQYTDQAYPQQRSQQSQQLGYQQVRLQRTTQNLDINNGSLNNPASDSSSSSSSSSEEIMPRNTKTYQIQSSRKQSFSTEQGQRNLRQNGRKNRQFEENSSNISSRNTIVKAER